MSYSKAGTEKFTLIDELPDLEDLESVGARHLSSGIRPSRSHSQEQRPDPNDPRFTKFIRDNYHPPQQSGMYRKETVLQEDFTHEQQQQYSSPPPPPPPPSPPRLYNLPPNSPSCLDVAEHVATCPICSKFYNNDRTPYIIAISVLLIICMLLLKRVLDV